MSKGVLMFAQNNVEIDYLRMAAINAYLVQHHLGLTNENIAIVTDEDSYDFVKQDISEEFLEGACANFIFQAKNQDFKQSNLRIYKDTSHTNKLLPFYNYGRADAYALSPFDQTILIDADYVILSDQLNSCWDHANELMMNWEFNDILESRKFPNLERISPMGIKMYWATVVYFTKNEFNETFFELVKHVRENKDYYRLLYRLPGNLYRNDYSFSIAAHIIGGAVDNAIPQLPFPLYKSWDMDDVHSAPSAEEIVMYTEKAGQHGDFLLARWKGDLHVMNKWALNRISTDLMDILNV